MKQIVFVAVFFTAFSLSAQKYHDAAAYNAHGLIKEIKSNSPALPSVLSKAKFDKEGKQVVSLFNLNMTDYDAEGYPVKLGEENAPLYISYSFDSQHRPILITWKSGTSSGKMSYSYPDNATEFPSQGMLEVQTSKKGEIEENSISFEYSDYTSDSQENWVTRKVSSTAPNHREYIEERRLKYHK